MHPGLTIRSQAPEQEMPNATPPADAGTPTGIVLTEVSPTREQRSPVMKIVVVGGVAGGASVAARARRLDESAEIIVFERGEYVSFANCGLPYHIGEVITDRSRLLLQTPESLNESLAIDVRVATEVVALDAEARTVTVREVKTGREYTESYDALGCAKGRTR